MVLESPQQYTLKSFRWQAKCYMLLTEQSKAESVRKIRNLKNKGFINEMTMIVIC